jgi:Holliday junction resolvase
MRRAAKVDASQEQIVSALRASGATVQSLAPIGQGCPDLLVAFRRAMYLFEVKTGKAEPNDLQKRWHIAWNADVHVVRSPDEALRVIGAIA